MDNRMRKKKEENNVKSVFKRLYLIPICLNNAFIFWRHGMQSISSNK